MSETPNRDELLALLKRLQRLLDPDNFEPGLMTWRLEFADAVEELRKWIG